MRARTFFATAAIAVAGLAAAVPVAQAGPLGSLSGSASGDSSGADFTLGGKPCKLIPVPAAAPVGTSPCPGVRPGAIVNSDKGQCSFNFLFTGSDGNRYMGTAGHCILGDSPIGGGDFGEQSWAP